MKSWWPIKKNNRLYHKSFQDLSGGRSPSLLACFNLGIHFFFKMHIYCVCIYVQFQLLLLLSNPSVDYWPQFI